MVPKPLEFSGNLNTSEPLVSEQVKVEGKEILYEGFYYDVGSFMERHPGGNIIKFYTEPGEDATMAIQQFHHRSIKQVLAIMTSFPKRPASQDKGNINANPILRDFHTNLSTMLTQRNCTQPEVFSVDERLSKLTQGFSK
jgi:hypothetical protein